MNYITDGTFWVVVIALVIVIGCMWYTLKKEIAKKEPEVTSLDLKDILYLIGVLYETIGVIQNNLNKKGQSEIEEFLETKKEKIENTLALFK